MWYKNLVFQTSTAFDGRLRQLMCKCADGFAGYVAIERVTGRIGERAGSFVLEHGATRDSADTASSFGTVVPGSGTGDLRGLRGEVEFRE